MAQCCLTVSFESCLKAKGDAGEWEQEGRLLQAELKGSCDCSAEHWSSTAGGCA